MTALEIYINGFFGIAKKGVSDQFKRDLLERLLSYEIQELTETQQLQARTNIGVVLHNPVTIAPGSENYLSIDEDQKLSIDLSLFVVPSPDASKSGSSDLTAGTHTINFITHFSGSDYEVKAEGWNGDEKVHVKTTVIDDGSFSVEVYEACNVKWIAVYNEQSVTFSNLPKSGNQAVDEGDNTITFVLPFEDNLYEVFGEGWNGDEKVHIKLTIIDETSFNIYAYEACTVNWTAIKNE